MDILSYADDLAKKKDGVKIPLSKDAYVLVAAAGTPGFYEAMLASRNRIAEDPENATPDENKLAYVEAFADAVLLGWGGITENGEDVEYSREKAIEWLSDPAKERFMEMIEAEARSIENFRARAIEKEKKH